jgi:hypothetical protein
LNRTRIARVLLAVVALATPPLTALSAEGQLPTAQVASPASDLPPAAPAVDPVWSSESPVKRFETVSLISLPFMALYSMILTAGAMLIFQKGHMKMTTGYRVTALTLAVGASTWIAWKDLKLHRTAPSSTPSDI